MWDGLICGAIVGGIPVIAFIAYLIFLGWYSLKHGPDSLPNLAVAVRAFPGAGMASAIARAIRPQELTLDELIRPETARVPDGQSE